MASTGSGNEVSNPTNPSCSQALVFARSVATFVLMCSFSTGSSFAAGIDIQISFEDESEFNTQQLELLDIALEKATIFWEHVILGLVGSDDEILFPVDLRATPSGLAAASTTGFENRLGFRTATRGRLFVNPSQVIPATDGIGLAPGLNVLDEVMIHELGHALGFGNLWTSNDVVVNGTGQYTGEFGLAAYREEYDPDAQFIPVELAGGSGSADSHWDQLFRSSEQEGNPDDPLSLSPLTGIKDARGRDLAQEIMSPALDPDFNAPYVSNTTVQSFRDIGFRVVEHFPTSICDLDGDGECRGADIDLIDVAIRDGQFSPSLDLHRDGNIDTLDRDFWIDYLLDTTTGDVTLDGRVEFDDFLALSQHFGEPGGWAMGDTDGNGEVDFADFLELSGNFGSGPAETVAVPEPSARLIAILISSCCLLLVRRPRSVQSP